MTNAKIKRLPTDVLKSIYARSLGEAAAHPNGMVRAAARQRAAKIEAELKRRQELQITQSA